MTDRTDFLATVRQLAEGQAALDLTDALELVVAAVRATGKPGSLTYTLTVRPAAQGETKTLLVGDAIKIKLPTLARRTSVFFATEDGGLSRKDPRQPVLEGLMKPADVRPMPERPAVAEGGADAL